MEFAGIVCDKGGAMGQARPCDQGIHRPDRCVGIQRVPHNGSLGLSEGPDSRRSSVSGKYSQAPPIARTDSGHSFRLLSSTSLATQRLTGTPGGFRSPPGGAVL